MRLFKPIRLFLLTAAVMFAGVIPAAAQSLLQMFPFADSITRYTVREESLEVLCKKKLADRYVTFVGVKGHNEVLLVAVTLKPIDNVKKDIWLTTRFDGISPKVGKVETWGYVFDRNADGKIDYLALLGGAVPVWGDDMHYFPERHSALIPSQSEQLIAHTSLVFNHWSDDNFDGKIDGAIHIDMFEERDWVKRRLVLQSTKCNGVFDFVSSFRKKPGDIADSVVAYDDGLPYYPIGEQKQKMFGTKMFTEMDNLLALMNKTVEECKIEKKLRGLPKKEE